MRQSVALTQASLGGASRAHDHYPVNRVGRNAEHTRKCRLPVYSIDADGVWCDVRAGATRGGGALFLDRDGVVVEETDYLCRMEDAVLVGGPGRRSPPPIAGGVPWSW